MNMWIITNVGVALKEEETSLGEHVTQEPHQGQESGKASMEEGIF